ncbi:glycosyltransferase family 4 protein [cf. Phormidesmis sp. LEGE 11477]|uniref:glycosyltransferase family 4 protein n=1 Tax=cf. Phormidesmis sp. LEGE 11477 TaxID=1828680 RepID=UPI00187ECF36|nr:glycosyltransferase family 4 protein [cf. Phormidesmis sp. LEGE 11477]MBE9060966.1 glycosyltransferase family 4 protein [cf. Phormidesmis sp. LEGE 11477]
MRILVYSYNYYPEPIGIAPLMTELAEGLVKRGHQVRVVTAMPNYPERKIYPGYKGKLYKSEYRNGVEIERCFVAIRPQPGLLCRALLESSFAALSVVKAISGWRPDVILSTSPSLTACLPVAVAKAFHRCPSVLSLQDILPEAAIQTGLLTNPLAIKVFEKLEKFAYANATKIGVISPSFTRNLVEKAVPAQKIECISNWVDVDFIVPMSKEDNAFRLAYGLGGKFVVLYAGNIARTQGVRTIIRAAAQMQSNADVQFVIVGEKSQLSELDQLRNDLGVQNLLLLPFVSRENLPEMLAAADVSLVMQKQNVVGFNMPSKIQVIMASGRPIIASVPAHSAAAEAIARSQGGMVTKPECPTALASAIQTLYDNPKAAIAFGQRTRQFAIENYSFDQAISAYEALLGSVIKDRTSDSLPQPSVLTITPDFARSDLNQ